jgi:hypothetical protein
MNSWGPEWGNYGIGWVKYKDFKHFVREAYGLNPMPKSGNAIATELNCQFGLVNENKQYIPLQYKGGNTFSTSTSIQKLSKFKVEVKNNAPCYVYIIGKETDGSSYVLFPYPSPNNPGVTMFNPYCGITGYRLFPRGKSLQADNIGNQDNVAIITSNYELDIFQINQVVSQNKSLGFANAVNSAVAKTNLGNVRFGASNDGTFGFNTQSNNKTTVAMILEINKQL